MSVSTVSEVPVNSRIEALRAKHRALSEQVDDARKNLSANDFYISRLKKEKLLVKEKLIEEERRASA